MSPVVKMMGQFNFSPWGIHGLAPIRIFHLKFSLYLDPVEQNWTTDETSGFWANNGKYSFY